MGARKHQLKAVPRPDEDEADEQQPDLLGEGASDLPPSPLRGGAGGGGEIVNGEDPDADLRMHPAAGPLTSPALPPLTPTAQSGLGRAFSPRGQGKEGRAPAEDADERETGAVTHLAAVDRRARLRIIEALLFAAKEPLDEATLGRHLTSADDVPALLAELREVYAERGVNLVQVAGRWAFRTADDLGYLLERYSVEERRLSRAALETLAIIGYHQPVTRAEIEEIRGVQTSKGTLDVLLETGWIRPRGRRRAPGKPLTYGTTEAFLEHFGFNSIKDLPGLAELKGAGLLDSGLPPDFTVPEPRDEAALMPDELPLEDTAEEEAQDEVPRADEGGEAPGGEATPKPSEAQRDDAAAAADDGLGKALDSPPEDEK